MNANKSRLFGFIIVAAIFAGSFSSMGCDNSGGGGGSSGGYLTVINIPDEYNGKEAAFKYEGKFVIVARESPTVLARVNNNKFVASTWIDYMADFNDVPYTGTETFTDEPIHLGNGLYKPVSIWFSVDGNRIWLKSITFKNGSATLDWNKIVN